MLALNWLIFANNSFVYVKALWYTVSECRHGAKSIVIICACKPDYETKFERFMRLFDEIHLKEAQLHDASQRMGFNTF